MSWPSKYIISDSSQRKSVALLLKELRQSRLVSDYQILTIKDEEDAQRKEFPIHSDNGRYPLLFILVRPVDSMSTNYVHRRLGDFGGVVVGNTSTSRSEKNYNIEELPPQPRNIIYDMETSDPDDVFALLFLLSHPKVRLKLVTVNPGSRDQVGFVHSILENFQMGNILIGSGNPKKKIVVDPFYAKHFAPWKPRDADGSAAELLVRFSDSQTTLVTGGALTNLAKAIDYAGSNFEAGELVCQGGFASTSMTEGYPQLEKFQGLDTASSFNFNANPKAVHKVMQHRSIGMVRLVCKNICHRFIFDASTLERFPTEAMVQGLADVKRIMTSYLDEKPEGKKIHDVIAAACAITPQIATWKQVEIFEEFGKWGTQVSSSSSIFISVDFDEERFLRTLLEQPSRTQLTKMKSLESRARGRV